MKTREQVRREFERLEVWVHEEDNPTLRAQLKVQRDVLLWVLLDIMPSPVELYLLETGRRAFHIQDSRAWVRGPAFRCYPKSEG